MFKISLRRINLDKIIEHALEEDVGKGDITTNLFDEKKINGRIIANEKCILCGTEIVKKIMKKFDKNCKIVSKKDGEVVKKGEVIMEIIGSSKILTGERVALNFLQHLSGISTETKKLVDASKGKFIILDTRKTHPGLRYLEKYAVIVGGGRNHRYKLDEMILIKDNHLKCINLNDEKEIEKLRKRIENIKKKYKCKVEIECSNYEELKFALKIKPDLIMLDNISIRKMKKWIEIIKRKLPGTKIEISGNVNENFIKNIQRFGIKANYVSVGYITNSAKDIDFTFELV